MARRKGLGSTKAEHKAGSKDYAVFFNDAVKLAERDLNNGSCGAALSHMMIAARTAGGMHVHRVSVRGGGKRVLRNAKQSAAVVRALGKLQRGFLNRCGCGR